MSKPIKYPRSNPARAFDVVFDNAYSESENKGKTKEPDYVRELVSEKTIRELNTAAASIYDENINIVRFMGGFIHGRPWAKFDATAIGMPPSECRRELADALVVLVMTHQDGTGCQVTYGKRACLLQAKVSNSNPPTMINFAPKGALLPAGTDEQQLYLYNQWPNFSLESKSGRAVAGKGLYSLMHASSAIPAPYGKYTFLWTPGTTTTWGQNWRYADPIPTISSINSLGELFEKIVDCDSSSGADVSLSTPVTDWDYLITDLLNYADTHSYAGPRLVNPAGLSFISLIDTVIPHSATLLQHARFIGSHYSLGQFAPRYWRSNSFGHYSSGEVYEDGDEGMPIMLITVSSFAPPEGGEQPTAQQKRKAVENAFQQLSRLGRGKLS